MNRNKINLKYIREKNNLRLGGSLVDYLKVSNEMIEDDILDMFRSYLIPLIIKYKMNLTVDHLDIGLDGSDLLHDLQTIKFKIVKIK